ncbi:U1 small nuclear ribonucleoprotein 70 kDa isoform X2 [Hydra vulgaris]|uniref:U1 small nuclear ribonucleoprotein 70 kDa n=1 Tax=Hydra vulgaris TaxID=6087 RepID=A0ABM4BEN5_HYDVU
MTQFLPANLLALFSARPPIPFKPPVEGLKKRKNSHCYVGLGDFVSNFEVKPPPPATRGETREEKEERKKYEKETATTKELERKLASWDPHTDPNASGDPFKTLFVARINYDTTESKLRRELETHGPIRKIHMVYNFVKRKPRGYAFVEFEHERDMQAAFKHSDGKKIDGRRIVVDVERGRTVKSWRPRRLGGGLGGTRRGGPDDNIRHSGRVDQWESRGGDRGDRDKDRDRERDERRERKRSRSPREKERKERDRSERDRSERSERSERRRDKDRDRGDDREDRSERRRDRDRDRRDRDRDRRGDRENVRPDDDVKKEPEEDVYEDTRNSDRNYDYGRYDSEENGIVQEEA